jgi:hypothetical protein
MNEQIKKLVKQSQKVVGYEDGGYTEITTLDVEKFAMLVAAECANICDDLKFTPEGPSHEAAYQRGLCGQEIRKVFSVPAVSRKKI